MKSEEIRTMTLEQLNVKLAELKSELFNLRFSHATRNLANPMAIRNVRKDIARVQTAIKEKSSKGESNGTK